MSRTLTRVASVARAIVVFLAGYILGDMTRRII